MLPYANVCLGGIHVVMRVLAGFSASVVLVCLVASQTVPVPSPAPTALPDLLKQGQEACRRGDFASAVEKYQAALRQDAKSDRAYVGLVHAYLKQQKLDLAHATATTGSAAVPGSVALHVAMGEVYFREARMPEAEKEFLQGVNTAHPEARAYFGLVALYDAYSLHAKAKLMLDRAHD